MSAFGGGADQRQFGRRQTTLHGWVTVPGRPRLTCQVQNLTVGGALLMFDTAAVVLPFSFKLTIEATRFETLCEIRHQHGGKVGVQFVATTAQVAPVRHSAIDSVQEWMGTGTQAPAAGARIRPLAGGRV